MSLLTRKPQAPLSMMTKLAGLSVNTTVDPAGTGRGPRQILSGYAPWIAATQACLIIAMLVMAGGVMCWCRPAQGADQQPAIQTSSPTTPLTFDEAVKIALTQSPAFTKSSLEIDIGRLDETDSRYAMVPPLTFRTFYYVNRPTGSNSGRPYSLNFSTDPYNPLGAYFSLQARKLATKAAILSHMSVISKGLLQLGLSYLQLDSLHKQAGIQKDLIKVAQENLSYAENRVAIGTGTSLEVKMAQQQLQLFRGEQEAISLSEKHAKKNLKNLLGWPSNQDITPAFYDSRRQVLGSFTPDTVTLEQAKTRSYELKVFEIYKELQQYNISLAIAKSLPTIIFTTQTPDPLNSSNNGFGLYVGLGLEIPVWDGFTRIRNVSRQRAVLKQIGAKKGEKEDLLDDKWFENLEKIQEFSLLLKSAQSMEELAQLKSRQQEVRYHSGEVPLSAFLESRIELIKAQRNTSKHAMNYDLYVLRLREFSGDLGNTYVDASAWQK